MLWRPVVWISGVSELPFRWRFLHTLLSWPACIPPITAFVTMRVLCYPMTNKRSQKSCRTKNMIRPRSLEVLCWTIVLGSRKDSQLTTTAWRASWKVRKLSGTPGLFMQPFQIGSNSARSVLRFLSGCIFMILTRLTFRHRCLQSAIRRIRMREKLPMRIPSQAGYWTTSRPPVSCPIRWSPLLEIMAKVWVSMASWPILF